MRPCPCCGSTQTAAADFVDEISFKERNITGWCQKCQDRIFVAPLDEMDEEDQCMDCGKDLIVRELVRGQVCQPCQTAREHAWQKILQTLPPKV